MMSLEKLASMVIRMSELKWKIEENCSTYLERIELGNLRGKLAKISNQFKSKKEACREDIS